MDIASFCIKHKVTTILAFVIVTVFGVVFYSNLKLSLMPEMEFPSAYVMATYPGANPEDVEELVTRPLESCVATLTGVKEISSTSAENISMVMISYEDGTDVDQAAVKLREKFGSLTLPEGASNPIIYNFNVNDMMPLSVLALKGDDLNRLQATADDLVVPALERIDGVAAAQVSGGVRSQITVQVNTNALAGYGLTIANVSDYLAASNILFPNGEVNNGTNTLTVTTDGTYQTVEDVAQTILFLPTGGTIQLRDVATVKLESSLQDSAAKVGDQNCVVLTINKQSGANEVEVMEKIKTTIAQLEEDNPSVETFMAYDSSDYIKATASNALQNIVMGVLLSAIVVYLFLRRPGATVTISMSMPFCVISVLLVMNLFHITLNMVSLSGIAICVGMVVDNSIVVLENIYRYAGEGYNRYNSCVLGTKEVVLPITASTLTTVAVFLPIGLSGGLAGMMFKDFALTVVFLILISLVIALTLVPLMCYFLLEEKKVQLQQILARKDHTKIQQLLKKLSLKYQAALRYFLKHRRRAVLLSLAMVAVFVLSCLSTNTVLMPSTDQGMLNINISMPTGSSLDSTIAYSDRVISIVEKNCPELDSLYVINGAGSVSMAANAKENASIVVNLVHLSERSRSSKEIANDLRHHFRDIAGCEITVSDYNMMDSMMGGKDIQVSITGSDYDVLTRIAADLTPSIAALDDAVDVENSVENIIPAVSVSVNRMTASQYGLTPATIGAAVRAELTGVTATTMTVDGNDVEVIVQGSGTSAQSLDALRSMPLPAPRGGTVPLSSVAYVSVKLSPQSINRNNQSREVTISGNTISGGSSEITPQIQEILDQYPMPEGYRADTGGTYSQIIENFRSLGLALLIAIGLVYFILASQFESFLMPLIVMLILPVALTGALFGLPLTGQDLSMIVLLGLIMLTGTVVNSSIVLVDYINVRRVGGQEKDDAILDACPLRVRPIMMTTMTTVLALIPMAAGIGGDGAELMKPLGVVMIFGMLISTFVTLLFTPVYYSLLDSFSQRIARPWLRYRERKDAQLDTKIAIAEAKEDLSLDDSDE